MANIQNLIKSEDLTPEQRRKNASKAGKASAKKRRERKAMQEQMEMLLSLPIKNEKAKKQLTELGIQTNEIDNQMALIVSLYQTALKGGKNSVQAFNTIQQLVEKNNTQQDNEITKVEQLLSKIKEEAEK